MQQLRWTDPTRAFKRRTNEIIEAWAHLFDGAAIDMGCGDMPYREEMSARGTYLGVDIDGPADLTADLCRRIPLTKAGADCIAALFVLEHLARPHVFLSECFRILKPGGSLLLTVPFQWQVHGHPDDYWRWTESGISRALRAAHFHSVKVEPMTGFWLMWVLKFNQHTARKFNRGPFRWLWPFVWQGAASLAVVLDRWFVHPGETVGYAVVARKP